MGIVRRTAGVVAAGVGSVALVVAGLSLAARPATAAGGPAAVGAEGDGTVPVASQWRSSAGAGAAFSIDQIPGSGYGPGDRVVALTFDDGPDPTWTPQVLSVLKRLDAPATFFEVGYEVAAHPELTAALVAAGMSVANHTSHHADLTRIGPSAWPAEVDVTSQLITRAGGAAVRCLRPPYGAFNQSVVSLAAARDLTTVLWTADSQDYRRQGVAAIVAHSLLALRSGAIIGLHDGGGDRSQTVAALPILISTLRARGYRLVPICGAPPAPPTVRNEVYGFGGAPAVGSALPSRAALVGGAASPSGAGYWTVAADGGVFGFGDAGFLGSEGGRALSAPVVGMAATPSGRGYWLVAADGGVFGFGDAGFLGSEGGRALSAPVVGMAATPSGRGYWLVAADGGVFGFGDAGFLGSEGGRALSAPVVGMAATPSGRGYWLVAADGGVFGFGDAGFLGSEGGRALSAPVVGMAATPSGRGYWLVAADGGVFNFGDAVFAGSRGGADSGDAFVAIAAPSHGPGYWLIGQRPGP